MSTFDSPICRCEAMRTMVVTDQTQRQCALEHECPPGIACPLADAFTGSEWPAPAQLPEPLHACERLAA